MSTFKNYFSELAL